MIIRTYAFRIQRFRVGSYVKTRAMISARQRFLKIVVAIPNGGFIVLA